MPAWTPVVTELGAVLKFPVGFNSPKDLDRAAVKKRFTQLADATAEDK
jgi:hypothetical protein